jgi:hypothetical protein
MLVARPEKTQHFRLPESGTLFSITAKEPELLPSYDILELQWHLQKLAAMSAAADVDPDRFDDDDDNWDIGVSATEHLTNPLDDVFYDIWEVDPALEVSTRQERMLPEWSLG